MCNGNLRLAAICVVIDESNLAQSLPLEFRISDFGDNCLDELNHWYVNIENRSTNAKCS